MDGPIRFCISPVTVRNSRKSSSGFYMRDSDAAPEPRQLDGFGALMSLSLRLRPSLTPCMIALSRPSSLEPALAANASFRRAAIRVAKDQLNEAGVLRVRSG